MNEFSHPDLETECFFNHVFLSKSKNNKQKRKKWFGNLCFNLLFSALGTETHTDDIFKNSLDIFRIGQEFEN